MSQSGDQGEAREAAQTVESPQAPAAQPQAPPPPPPPPAEPRAEASEPNTARPDSELLPAFGLFYLAVDLVILLAAKSAPVHYAISIPVAFLVYLDCNRREQPAGWWTFAVAVLGGLAFVFYPFSRRRHQPPAAAPPAATGSAPAASNQTVDQARETAEAAARQAGVLARGAAERVRQSAAKVQERQRARSSPATARAATSTDPAASSGEPNRRAADRPYLRELIQYLWGAETTPKPTYKAWMHGLVVDDFAEPAEQLMRPYTMPRTPYGRIIVWPGWLVYLSESHNDPGRLPAGIKWVSLFLDHYREYRKFASTFRVLRAAHAQLTKEQRDLMQRALVNPNSIILPLDQVRGVRQERVGFGSARMLVQLADGRELLFGVNGYLEIGPSMWRMFQGIIGPWHPQLQKILREAADQSKEE